MTPLVMLLGVFVAVRAIDAVLYDYYMREGRYVRAFLIRPLHFLRRAL